VTFPFEKRGKRGTGPERRGSVADAGGVSSKDKELTGGKEEGTEFSLKGRVVKKIKQTEWEGEAREKGKEATASSDRIPITFQSRVP